MVSSALRDRLGSRCQLAATYGSRPYYPEFLQTAR